MNKSKFLKKSLAMLLALMLVVAMIPLSASAAAPVLREASVNGYGLTVDNSAHTITGSIPKNDTEFSLKVLVQAPIDNTEVWYYDVTTEADTATRADGSSGSGIWEIENKDVDDYLNADGKVEIKLETRNTISNEKQTYTVTLDRVSASTDTSITKLVLWDNTQDLSQLGYSSASRDDATIEVTMPHTTGSVYSVSELELPAGAKATYTDDVTPATTITADKNGKGTVVKNGGVITVSNGDFHTNYVLKITAASGFETFSVNEAIDAKVFSSENKIAVLLPYGYSTTAENLDADGNMIVTPVFDVDYENVTVSWNTTTLTSGETAITVDPDKVNWNQNTRYHAFETYEGTADRAWKYNSANAKSWIGTDPFITKNSSIRNRVISGATLHVEYTEASSKNYEVYFFETYQNNEAEIKEVTIGSETATIDQDAKTIDITLPAGSDASKIGDPSARLALNIVASDEADITVPMQSDVTIEDTDGTAKKTRFEEDNFAITAASKEKTINAKNPVTIRVAAEDGKTTVDYTLNVKVADTYEKAAITGLYLRAPGSEDPIEPDTSKTVDGKKAFIFTVPYSVYDKGDLAGYKLFYTKTVGATMTYINNTDNKVYTMPKSGVEITTANSNFVPKPGVASSDPDYKVAYTVTSVNPTNDSDNSTTYYVVIKRANPSEESKLINFALTGTIIYNDLTDNRIFDATIDQEADDSWTADAQIPWAEYQIWSQNKTQDYAGVAFGSQATVSENAKAYVLDATANTLTPLKEVRKGVTGAYEFTYGNVVDSEQRSIVVLSERFWVNLINDPATSNHVAPNGVVSNWSSIDKTNDNFNDYTVYALKATQEPAETSTQPISMTLVDGTGWTADLKVNIDKDESGNYENTITGEIPYALTSELKADGTPVEDSNGKPVSVNPIYIDYSVADRAWVLGVDDDLSGTTVPKVDVNTKVPTAGNGKAVFADYSDYAGTTRTYSAAYLLIARDGTVYVYYGVNSDGIPEAGNKVANVVADKISVAAEGAGTVPGCNCDRLTFGLTVKEPNDEAEFKSFGFKGINSTATIDQDTDTITVTLPYGTEYTFLTPVYTTSDGAEVYVQDTDTVNGDDGVGARGWIKSGESTINFSTSRRFRVEAENESDYTTYTVNVKVSDQFTDVNPGDWFYDNVMNAVANGYMSGLGDGTFGPMKTATRAQFATALASAMGYEAPEDPSTIETPFIDVDANDWYAGAVNFCYDEGIISGYEDTTFRPAQTITRQEAAAMLNNAFGLEASTDVSQFTDAGRIASWATAHVAAVANAELMNGDVAGTFRPTGTLTRAELASILMNANIHGFID